MRENMPLFSIITATYNAESSLENLIKSVLSQMDNNAEFIIIDGGSTDSTLEIIKNHSSKLYWISELDNGIYDAWNKGIKIAKGKWIMFLGADDLLLPNSLNSYNQFFNQNGEGFDIVTSKIEYVSAKGKHIKFIGEPWNWEKFIMSKMSFAHPGMLHNKQLFIKYGLFDSSYKICGDSDFLLRTKGNIRAGFLNFVTAKMQQGGASFSVRAIIESYKVRNKNRTLPILLNVFRFVTRLIIFFISKLKLFLK